MVLAAAQAKLILTVGAPGCGKSTWAREMLAKHPDWVQVERDEIRKELGFYPYGNREQETQGRQVQHERIAEALRAGKTVICSDTNLNATTRDSLKQLAWSLGARVSTEDFRDVPVEVCVARDAQRPEGAGRVGREVIEKFAAAYRKDDPIEDGRPHVVIGDVHGDCVALTNVLAHYGIKKTSAEDLGKIIWVNPYGYKVVFLGDLNDPYTQFGHSSLKCIKMAHQLWLEGHAEILQSNHHNHLIKWFRGDLDTKLRYGMEYTAAEFAGLRRRTPVYADKLISFLEGRPYSYTFQERNVVYSCAHARWIDGVSQYHPTPEQAQILSSQAGPYWKDTQTLPTDRVVIVGHHERLEAIATAARRLLILDGGCGSRKGGRLGSYEPCTGKAYIWSESGSYPLRFQL